MENLQKIIHFLHEIEGLKKSLRWSTLNKEGRGESSAEHSWRLALMVILISKELRIELNQEKAIKIALVHDIAEAVTGDIDATLVANGVVKREDKARMEKEALEMMKAGLPEALGREIYELWLEYERCETPEARFIKALDKLESLIQATEFDASALSDFDFLATYADKPVSNFPQLKPFLAAVKQELRRFYEQAGKPWKDKYNEV